MCSPASRSLADAGEVVLRLPADLRRRVRGVVQADGDPLADTIVEIDYCMHITQGGGTQFDSPPAIPCDNQGRFSLPVLSRRDAWLCVRVGGSLRKMVPVEVLPETGEITIALNGRRWLQLVGSAAPAARAIHFELASGQVVATGTAMAKNGEAPLVPIPADALAVVLRSRWPGLGRLGSTGERAVLLRLR